MRLPAASRRNRKATFLSLDPAGAPRDAVFNTPATGWMPVCEEWIEVQDMLPSRAERVAEGIDLASRPCRIRMLYRDDITSAMRVRLDDDGGRILRIVSGPAELGFREGMELVAEEVSTQGAVP